MKCLCLKTTRRKHCICVKYLTNYPFLLTELLVCLDTPSLTFPRFASSCVAAAHRKGHCDLSQLPLHVCFRKALCLRPTSQRRPPHPLIVSPWLRACFQCGNSWSGALADGTCLPHGWPGRGQEGCLRPRGTAE